MDPSCIHPLYILYPSFISLTHQSFTVFILYPTSIFLGPRAWLGRWTRNWRECSTYPYLILHATVICGTPTHYATTWTSSNPRFIAEESLWGFDSKIGRWSCVMLQPFIRLLFIRGSGNDLKKKATAFWSTGAHRSMSPAAPTAPPFRGGGVLPGDRTTHSISFSTSYVVDWCGLWQAWLQASKSAKHWLI